MPLFGRLKGYLCSIILLDSPLQRIEQNRNQSSRQKNQIYPLCSKSVQPNDADKHINFVLLRAPILQSSASQQGLNIRLTWGACKCSDALAIHQNLWGCDLGCTFFKAPQAISMVSEAGELRITVSPY